MTEIAPRPEVMRFAEAMERVLRENDHKSGWETIPQLHLLWAIKKETIELLEAIIIAQHQCQYPHDPNMNDVLDEACDVANFAAFINAQLLARTKDQE